MNILLETTIPESGHLSVHVHADVEIHISAQEAQQRVTRFVHERISSQMHGEAPVLILGEQTFWRVPVHLTFPSIGDAGSVGSIQVDVLRGELSADEQVIREIEDHAEILARRFVSTPTR